MLSRVYNQVMGANYASHPSRGSRTDTATNDEDISPPATTIEPMTLPIQMLIANRCRELGLGHGELVRRCGYQNISKGIRRLMQICVGDLQKGQTLLRVLHIILEVSPDVVDRAVEETRQQLSEAQTRAAAEKEAAWRGAFKPHAIILTERKRPEPIFVAAFTGVERLLRVDFDLSAGRPSYVNQALNGISEKLSLGSDEISAFGRPIGVVVNYTPDRAVRFDLEGNAIEILSKAYRPGEARLSIGGRRIPLGVFPNMTEVACVSAPSS